jgi:hypothetical protein
MNHGSRLVFRFVVALLVGAFGLAGCENAETGSGAGATGAGIPQNRGPVSSKMPKAGSKVQPTFAGPRARRAAPAPDATPTEPSSEKP